MDINIDKLTIGQVKEISKLIGKIEENNLLKHGFEVGKAYFIRSVTHHYLGKVIAITDLSIVMNSCVWVADDGRFNRMVNGDWDSNSEREPYGEKRRVQVFLGGMIDAVEWEYDIPQEVK